MNEKRLISWSKNLIDLLPEDLDTAQEIYDYMITVFHKRGDYFDSFPPEFLLKLIIYIYSLRNTGDIILAREIIDKIVYLGFLSTSGDYHEENCNDCGGDGYQSCYECEGSGSVTCNTCDGDEELTCDVCDGEKFTDCDDCGGSGENDEGETCDNCGGSGQMRCEECDGKGVTTCWDCAGDGEKDCPECEGNGTISCDECNGRGEIETDEYDYEIQNVCTWDNNLIQLSEIRVNTLEPIDFEDENFQRNSIVLSISDEHDTFVKDIDYYKFYCFEIDKKPTLHRKLNRKITPDFDSVDADWYFR